jgi:hypothetical protein
MAARTMMGEWHITGFLAMYNHEFSAVATSTPLEDNDDIDDDPSNVNEISLPRLALIEFVFPDIATSHVRRRASSSYA